MKICTLPLLLAGLMLAAGAHASAATHVTATQGWIRILPGKLPAGAYVTLTNSSDQAEALSGASSAAYAEVMLHQSSTQGGVSRMYKVKSLKIPAHGTASLTPGGYHLMLMKAVRAVKPGDIVKITLRFSDGSSLVSDFIARPANAMGASD
ncbi:MAG: copper chaperone PCu(A)C [Rhodanobacter sp.]|nr:MAG: copper chaperone PCu(A)C [Rhodanobacter sp.]